ncbi:Retrovirus-related Pol polyprotein from transposon TNT 1-94 [Senna tora]|uniref:Retrovirus-related Pol polyprotein from transposon TNT 1-94 n=1 Tax=Senna tora TaxID=362788 RepID=A0A834SGM7_9FABA|nr:Retrovirus-related Pol polyprotein from transposon TNT 1-94 [Senna tora]
MREHHGDRVIITADNSTYPVVKEGVVTIDVADTTRGIKLNDVYHVPGLTKNLVSVPQITDSGKYVLFGPNDVKVLDNVNNISADVVLTGRKKGSLFVMSAGEAYVKKTSQTDSVAIWHARLGHVGYQMLQQISSKKLLDGMPTLQNVRECVICQGCQYGKSHRLPFKRKGWRCMDPKTKQYTTSRDVVFDEVSSLFSAQKVVTLGDDQDNLELLFLEGSVQTPCNEEAETEPLAQHITREEDDDHQAVRRSTREKKQPDYLKDYEVDINNCSVTSCFFTGALTAEVPTTYEEAKGCPNWEKSHARRD